MKYIMAAIQSILSTTRGIRWFDDYINQFMFNPTETWVDELTHMVTAVIYTIYFLVVVEVIGTFIHWSAIAPICWLLARFGVMTVDNDYQLYDFAVANKFIAFKISPPPSETSIYYNTTWVFSNKLILLHRLSL